MTKQVINVGITANDKKGDSLRAAFQKVNTNFTELYTALGLDDTTLNLGAFEFTGSVMSTTDSTAITIDQATTITSDLTVSGNIVPSNNLSSTLGSPTKKFHSIYVGTGSVYLGDAKLSLENGRIKSSVGFDVTGSVGTVDGAVDWSNVTSKPNIPTDVSDLTDTNQILVQHPANKLQNGDFEVSLGIDGSLTVPASSNIRGTNDLNIVSEVEGNFTGLFLNGNPLLGSAILYANRIATIRADSGGTVKDWTFDKLGTLTTPLLLPVTFTATLDPAHFVGDLALTGDAWEFEVQFQVNPDGTVQTMIGNNTPFVSNPGYVDGQQFEYTETDHGIPGYTFTLGLADVLLAGPAGWTTNLTASVPPTYPSTVNSQGAIKLTSNSNSWTFGTTGILTVPAVSGENLFIQGPEIGSLNSTIAVTSANGIQLTTDALGTAKFWQFDTNGNVTYPGGITQSQRDNTICPAGVDTVVYTSTGEFQRAIKLFVMVEGTPDGGSVGLWDTQACDVIAVKGEVNNIVHVTTYGVTYTSASAFATFDGQWNATTNRIEITCSPVSVTNNVTVSVHAIEIQSND